MHKIIEILGEPNFKSEVVHIWKSPLCEISIFEDLDGRYTVIIYCMIVSKGIYQDKYDNLEIVAEVALLYKWCFEIEFNDHPICFHIKRISGATLHQGVMHLNGKAWVFDMYDNDYNPISIRKTHILPLILDKNVGSIEFHTDEAQKYIDQFPEIIMEET